MFNCLFCKKPSKDSRSAEHILPESMGNRNRTLPPGTVCDSCNNYFARKVEAPVLEHDAFRNLRARWQIPNKNGTMPRWRGELAGANIPVGLKIASAGIPELSLERAGDRMEANRFVSDGLQNGKVPYFVFNEAIEPPECAMSRFLAKMAFEALAQRYYWAGNKVISNFLDIPHWDSIRLWARYGSGIRNHWPYLHRVIAPELTYQYQPASNTWVRSGFSYDVFITKRNEMFFTLVLYGHEWVINLGGPSTKGYKEWLEENSGISPLVERVGMRLVERNGEHGFGHYWEGEGSFKNGAEFDRTQIEQNRKEN